MQEKKYYHAYEDRYSRVYKTGARFWNQHEPSRALLRFLERYELARGDVLEMGCGEGFEARFLAQKGFKVVGVDLSPTVIEKNRRMAQKAGLDLHFLVGDNTHLPQFSDRTFDLVVNIGSYHMLQNPDDRKHCLVEVVRLLRPGGFLFFQNGLALKEAERFFPEDMEEITAFRKVRLSKQVSRTLVVNGKKKQITVPVTPRTFFGTLEEFKREILDSGLMVEDAYPTNEDKINAGWEAVIIARKK